MERRCPDSYPGTDGTTIYACRDAETFTIRINDSEDTEIGAISGVTNVPHGLMMAEGYVQGYYRGYAAGRYDLYKWICDYFKIKPELTFEEVEKLAMPSTN